MNKQESEEAFQLIGEAATGPMFRHSGKVYCPFCSMSQAEAVYHSRLPQEEEHEATCMARRSRDFLRRQGTPLRVYIIQWQELQEYTHVNIPGGWYERQGPQRFYLLNGTEVEALFVGRDIHELKILESHDA